MELYAKASSSADEIREKLKRGAEGIEIQLLSAHDRFFSCSEWSDELGSDLLKSIRAVHLPLSDAPGYGNYPIETPSGMDILKKTCIHTWDLTERLGHRIHVICHYSSSKDVLEGMGHYSTLIDEIRRIGILLPGVNVCIENTPYDFCHWDNNNVQLVKDVGLNNVTTCIDTCHALMTEKLMTAMNTVTGGRIITIEDTFKANEGLCNHIHLAGAEDKGFGYGRKTGHGTPFTGADDKDLVRSLALIKRYAPVSQVVLEVPEDDYLNCVNYSEARKNVLLSLAV